MAKVKKFAKGGSYYITVPDPPKASPKEKAKPVSTGWNIPVLNPTK